MGKVSFGEINVAVRRGGKTAQLLHTARDRIEELEVAVRVALSYIQNQPCSNGNGHAEMVIATLRGALNKTNRD